MLETYLFISPWGDECFHCEKETIRYFKNANEKVDFKVIPVLNMQIIQRYIHRQKEHGFDVVADYNTLFEEMYQTVLDYKAACYQGRQKGRKFLVNIQEAIINEHQTYSKQLGTDIAKEVGIDLECFEHDRRSNLAQKEFKLDQQLSQKMSVDTVPASVIFNLKDEECGVLIDHYDYNTLASVCQLKLKDLEQQQYFEPHVL